MIRDEGERLAALETEVVGLRKDLIEVKGDVKTLLTSQAAFTGAVGFARAAVPFLALGVSLSVLVLK